MSWRGTASFLLILLMCGAPVLSVPRQGTPTITTIEIVGNQHVPEDTIRSEILLRIGEPFLSEKADVSARAIQGLGFFQAVKVDTKPVAKGAKVIFTVKENPIVHAVNVSGNFELQSDWLLRNLMTQAGKLLSFVDIRKDVEHLQDLYHERGYLLARVVDVSNNLQTGVVSIRIAEGTIEQVAVRGNDLTKEVVILREMKTRVGQAVNQKILGKDLQRIFNLGYFEEVTPNFEPGLTAHAVALVIQVKERRTNSINFGGGFGEREGGFGFIDLSVDNLFGTGQGLLIRGQTGVNVTSYQFRYNNPWLFPHLLGARTGFTFRRWFTQGREIYLTSEEFQDQQRNGYEIEFRKIPWEDFSVSLSFGNDEVTPIRTGSFEAFNSFTTGLGFTYDTRDVWLNPSTGKLYSFTIRRGVKTASRQTEFYKYGLDFTQFFRLVSPQVFAAHLGLGVGMGDVPINEIFFVGGANTVRGYSPPQATNGPRKVLLNLEYRYTFNEILQAVLFYDLGNAFTGRTINTDNFLSGRGFGFRLTTPLGPIRLDYGVGNGRNLGEGITHFSIGQAF